MSLFYFCLDDLSNDGSGVLKKNWGRKCRKGKSVGSIEDEGQRRMQ